MTVSKVLLTALLAASATVGVAAVSVAQVNNTVATASATNSANALIAAQDGAARTALYTSLIGTNFQSADAIMAQVISTCSDAASGCSQAKIRDILQEVLAYLQANGADATLVANLSDKYATQLAFVPTEGPAAGPDDFGSTGQSFGATEDGSNEETMENANQVSPNRPQ